MLGTPLVPAPVGGKGGKPPLRKAAAGAAGEAPVLDERGRPLRLHGAFTGGFSAGYHNTVGSAEGWQPSSFHSSRTARAAPRPQLTMADYMDEEDDELLGASLAPTLAFDTAGARGAKRGREVVESEAQGGGSGAAIIPGPIPSELVVPVTIPVGQQIAAAMAARRGRGGSGGASVGAAWGSTQDYGMEALFREGTRRDPGACFGLGFDPGALRVREDAAGALARRGRGPAGEAAPPGGAAGWGGGSKRLHMAHALSAAAYGEEEAEEAAGGGQQRLLLRSGMVLAGGEEGEDDVAVYRQAQLKDYDIPLNAREAAAAERSAARASAASSSSAAAAAAAAAAFPTQRTQHLLKNAASGAPPATAVGWNGSLAMPGFEFAVHVERTFSQWARAYAPPIPPASWLPAVIQAPPPPPSASAAPAPPPLHRPHSHHQPPPHQQAQQPQVSAARAALDALISKNRFVSAGEGSGGAAAAGQGPASALVPLPIGATCKRSVETWLPAALLLKRLGVPDPFSREDRQRLESLGGKEPHAFASSASSSSSLPSAPASKAATVPEPPPPPPPALLATLAPLTMAPPLPSLLNNLFGAGWTF